MPEIVFLSADWLNKPVTRTGVDEMDTHVTDRFLLCPASWNDEGGDGASAGRHASDWSAVRLLPQETSEYFDL